MHNTVEAWRVRANRNRRLDPNAPSFNRQLAAGMVIRASLSMTRVLDTVLRPLDLTFARYHVLSVVHAQEDGIIAQSLIADDLCLHVSSITGKIKRLVDDGYVTREQFPEDRRTTYIAITPAGTRLYEQAHDRMTKMGSGLDQLDIENLRSLSELLQQVVFSAHDALERID